MPKKTFSRPKDKSLQAYKDWISRLTHLLNPDAEDTMTEEEWGAAWKKFWSKVDGESDNSKNSKDTA